MKTYAIVLIDCGSVAAALIFLCGVCNIGKKKKTRVPTSTRPQIIRPPLGTTRDLELGKTSKTTNNDGGMVILAGAAASVATAAVIISGGGGGDSGGGCGGGGCGGGGCGGGCGG
uniref:glycine, alanine and asparagine-rich protein-like n=1 Tax=Erigeron canadensis TaxID=72917 RepID=UPI001CB8E1CA|nr:glycine, alanine and asparagine-rich protein-like [Erigeron canadensis]